MLITWRGNGQNNIDKYYDKHDYFNNFKYLNKVMIIRGMMMLILMIHIIILMTFLAIIMMAMIVMIRIIIIYITYDRYHKDNDYTINTITPVSAGIIKDKFLLRSPL